MPANAAPLFHATLEVEADQLEGLAGTYCEKHVSATPTMCWPFNITTKISKYSFSTTEKLQFEVDFTGDIQLGLSQPVLLCLKGAEMIPRPTLKLPKLPFKLTFPDGVILKVGERVIDTFPNVPPSLSVPSWFTSQASAPANSSPLPQAASSLERSPSRLDSSPNQQLRHTTGGGSGVTRRSPVHSKLLAKPFHTPNTTVPPPCTPPNQPRADLPRANKRPRESTDELPAQQSLPQGENTANSAQSGRSEHLPGDESMVQKPRKKRRRRDKKSVAIKSHAPERNPALDMIAGFWSQLVGTYIPLVEAPSKVNSKISIVGVVRGISLPKLTRNGDWSVCVELLDPSVTEQTAYVVNLFLGQPLQDCIPNVKAGDILVLLKITVVNFKGQIRGTGYSDTFQWAGYSQAQKVHFHSTRRSFSDEEHCPFFIPGEEELRYAARLAEWWTALQDLAKSKPEGVPALMPAPRGRSLITLSEAKVDVFFNCIVEILYTTPPGDQFAEIFVTDYTVHPQFFSRQPRENEKHDQIKVYGKRVLKVVLWGPTQLEHVRELEAPGYYFIDNLRVKLDSKGYLEGTLQDDRRKIDKLWKDDPILADLLNRKKEYVDNPPSDYDAPRKETVGGRDPNLYCAGDLLPTPTTQLPSREEPEQREPRVTSLLYQNIVQTPIYKILGHSSCPEIFCIRARVAAFEPYKLENFSREYCTRCRADLLPRSTACHDCADSDHDYVAYEYRVQLCVEEESKDKTVHRASLIVDVFGKEAEIFFGGPPMNLRDVKNAGRLRKRLAPILGNLEAYQCDMATGNSLKALERGQYFDMLVQSYRSAHKSEGALDNKRYRLWGTKLLTPESTT